MLGLNLQITKDNYEDQMIKHSVEKQNFAWKLANIGKDIGVVELDEDDEGNPEGWPCKQEERCQVNCRMIR